MKIKVWIRNDERGNITLRLDYDYEDKDTPPIQRYGRKLLAALEGTADEGGKK